LLVVAFGKETFMAIHYWRFVENQRNLTKALQRMTLEEQGLVPKQIQTPAERRKSAAEVRAVERSVEGFIARNRRYQKRTKNISRGQY
jgi:hypothetical protein